MPGEDDRRREGAHRAVLSRHWLMSVDFWNPDESGRTTAGLKCSCGTTVLVGAGENQRERWTEHVAWMTEQETVRRIAERLNEETIEKIKTW